MRKIYITGISGTGKTAVGRELQSRGYFVLDIDLYEHGLCLWRDKNTGEKGRPKGIGKEWFESHEWVCDGEKLKGLINKQEKDVFFAVGVTANQDEYLDFFDNVFLLKCSEKTFLDRIDSRTENSFGKESFERENILNIYKNFEENLIQKGVIVIDAEKSILEIADFIENNILK